MRTLIPKILDISVLQWEGHELSSLDKLGVALDKEFEFGFKNVMKRWLKTKHCKLKVLYLGGKTECLVNVKPVHWEKLKVYYNKPETERKVE